MALARSHRTHVDRELIQWDKDWANLATAVTTDLGKFELKANLQARRRKRFMVSGNELKTLSDLYGYFNVVLFSPDDLQLVKGSPSLRRQFLDVMLAQSNKVYRSYLVDYNRVLQQRNATLKLIAEQGADLKMLEVWDLQLIDLGSRIIQSRYEALQLLQDEVAKIHRQMTGDREELMMLYFPFFLNSSSRSEFVPEADNVPDEVPSYDEIYAQFSDALKEKRPVECRRGVSLVGPQRDDIGFYINGIDARTYGSQGQQRTVVLSCKLGEAEYMRSQTGEFPVLLLDDVMSELDAGRRRFFLEAIEKKIQILLTTTATHSFTEQMLADARIYRVEAGTIAVVN